ncbi:MAG: hypothetical protein AB1782_08710 [Cyanobacteriota bacterium]
MSTYFNPGNGNVPPVNRGYILPNNVNNLNNEQAGQQLEKFFNVLNNYDSINPENVFSGTISNPKLAQKQLIMLERAEKIMKQRIESEVRRLLAQVGLLATQAKMGDAQAFLRLTEIAGGKVDNAYVEYDTKGLNDILSKAQTAIDNLSCNIEGSPKLLSLLIQFNLTQLVDMEKAKTNLMKNAASSGVAMVAFKKLLLAGIIRLDEVMDKLISSDPTKAITVLSILAVDNIPKEMRLSIVEKLSEVAGKQAQTNAGGLAAKALEKIIVSEGQNQILDQAFDGLKTAAMAGNQQAFTSLANIALSPVVSFNKAYKAIECLTEIGLSGSGSGGKATDLLIGFTENKNACPSIKKKSVDGLTRIVASGNQNSDKASNALLKLASNPEDSTGYRALTNILKMKNTDSMDQDKLINVLHNAARNDKMDFKTRAASLDKLSGIAENNGASSDNAKNAIEDLSQSTYGRIKHRAKRQLNKMNNQQEGNNFFQRFLTLCNS